MFIFSYNDKSFRFTNSASKIKHVLFVNQQFLLKILLLYSSSNIPPYIEKKPKEKLCIVLKVHHSESKILF